MTEYEKALIEIEREKLAVLQAIAKTLTTMETRLQSIASMRWNKS